MLVISKKILGTCAIVALALATTMTIDAGDAFADAEATACIQSSDAGQAHRDDGRLRASRADFRACSRDTCPSVVRADCARWLSDVEMRLPSIIVRAKDSAGNEVFDVSVSLDGEKLVDRLDGRLITVDVGAHVLRFSRPDGSVAERTTTLREGEKDRTIDVVFDAHFSAPQQPQKPTEHTENPVETGQHPSLVLPIALAGVAVASGIVFAIMASSAKSDADDLRTRCAPACPRSDVDSARTKLLVANVSIGVGIVALSAAAIVYVLGNMKSTYSSKGSVNALLSPPPAPLTIGF